MAAQYEPDRMNESDVDYPQTAGQLTDYCCKEDCQVQNRWKFLKRKTVKVAMTTEQYIESNSVQHIWSRYYPNLQIIV